MLSLVGLRLSSLGVRTDRICEDHDVSLTVFNRCQDKQNLRGPGCRQLGKNSSIPFVARSTT